MPPGVEVYIDRESVGSGPTTKHLPVGEHTYMVKGPGGASPETTFKVESGRTSVLNLRTTQAGEVAVTGTVEVHTAPLHATVTADGTVMGQTPISFSLSPGRHELVISLPGYQQVEQVVEVIANQTVRKNFQLVHQ